MTVMTALATAFEWRVLWRRRGWTRRWPMGARYWKRGEALARIRQLERLGDAYDIQLQVRECGPWMDGEACS